MLALQSTIVKMNEIYKTNGSQCWLNKSPATQFQVTITWLQSAKIVKKSLVMSSRQILPETSISARSADIN